MTRTKKGKVILVSSGKGGTGKTMFTVNLGALLAQRNERVLLIDFDIGFRNMDIYLGMENKVVYNVKDVMSGTCRANKAIIKVDGFGSLYFMAASPKKEDRGITAFQMKLLCDGLCEYFDYIIIDCPPDTENLLPESQTAGKVVLLTEHNAASLRDTDTAEKHMRAQGMKNTSVVINKVKANLMGKDLLPEVGDMIDMFSSPVAGIIQEDDNIRISTNNGTPIVCKKGTYIEKNFQQIADVLISGD